MKRPLEGTTELSARTGLSESTYEKKRVYGGGPPYIKIGRAVRYDPDEVDAWLEQQRRTNTSQEAMA